jgi:hypothetical protein
VAQHTFQFGIGLGNEGGFFSGGVRSGCDVDAQPSGGRMSIKMCCGLNCKDLIAERKPQKMNIGFAKFASMVDMTREGIDIAVRTGSPHSDSLVPIYAMMLQERHRLPKLRACVDWWRECLAHNRPYAST